MVWNESLQGSLSEQSPGPLARLAGPPCPQHAAGGAPGSGGMPAPGFLPRSPRSPSGQGCEPARLGDKRGDPGSLPAREGPAWLRPHVRDIRRVVTRVDPASRRPGWAGLSCAPGPGGSRPHSRSGTSRVCDVRDPPPRTGRPRVHRGRALLGPVPSLEFPGWPEGKWAGDGGDTEGGSPGGGAAARRDRALPRGLRAPGPARPATSAPCGEARLPDAPPDTPRPASPASTRRRPIGGRPAGASRAPIVMQI